MPQVAAHALGWVVTPERILRSVLLPAPLRPITPNHLARADIERDILQRPEELGGHRELPRAKPLKGHSDHLADCVHEGVVGASAAPESVLLPKTPHPERDSVHG